MSDRDEKDVCWDGGAHCDRHRSLGKCCHCGKKFAAPVEPPVLSREFLDSLIEKIWNSDARPLGNLPWAHKDVYDDAFTLLRDAILESLSQELK